MQMYTETANNQRFKSGPPEIAPHSVLWEMGDLAHKHGYFIRGIKLVYYYNGEEYLTEVSKYDVVQE